MAGIRAAIDMQNFAGDKAGLLKKEHCLDDVVYFAHPADGVQAGKKWIRFLRMHRRPSDAVMLTIWPEPAFNIQTAAFCEMWKKPCRLTPLTMFRACIRQHGGAGDCSDDANSHP